MEDGKYLEAKLIFVIQKRKDKPQNRRKYLECVYLTMGYYPEYVKKTKNKIQLKIRWVSH